MSKFTVSPNTQEIWDMGGLLKILSFLFIFIQKNRIVIVLFDASNGRLLALADSIETTIIRMGAATGVAAKHLALPNDEVAAICGCGSASHFVTCRRIFGFKSLEHISRK